MDNRYKRLGLNSVLVFIGKAGSSLVALLMLPLYTSWLSTDEFGSADLINIYVTILVSILSCSIASSIFVIPNKVYKEKCISYYSTGLFFIFFVSVLSILTFYIFWFLSNSSGFIACNGWMIIMLTLSMIYQTYTQQFTRTIDKMRIFSAVGIVQSLSTAILAIVIIPKFGFNGYILSLIISNLLAAIFAFVFSGSYHFIDINSISKKNLCVLLKYGIPLVPNSIMWWLVSGFNRPLMESHLGLAAIGLYAVGMKFPSLITSVSDVFMNAFSISLIEEYGKSNYKDFFNNIFRLVYLIVIGCALFITIFAPNIVRVFASDEYFEAWRIMPVLTLSSVFACAASLVGGVFVARKESKYYLYSSIYGALASIVCTLCFINIWGIMGCAIASCMSFFIMFLARFKYAINDITGFPIRWFLVQTILLILAISVSLLMNNFIYGQGLMYCLILLVLLYTNRDIYKVLLNLKRK